MTMESILYFFVLIAVVIVSMVAGFIIRDFTLMRTLLKRIEQARSQPKIDPTVSTTVQSEETTERVCNGMYLSHEIIGDQHFFYDESDHTFICQGVDLAAAAVAYTRNLGKDHVGMFQHRVTQQNYFFLDSEIHESSESAKSA